MRISAAIARLGMAATAVIATGGYSAPADASPAAAAAAPADLAVARPGAIPAQAQAIVKAAQRWVTSPVTPYCWGGGDNQGPTHGDGEAAGHYSGPKGKSGCYPASAQGFDCSGLVKYAIYQALHISLYHSAQDQSEGITDTGPNVHPAIIPFADIKPGDVVVFGTSKSTIDHDGIYVGNGQIVNAYDYKNDGDNGTNNQYWGVMQMALSWVRGGVGVAAGVRDGCGGPRPGPSPSPGPKPSPKPSPSPRPTPAPKPSPSPSPSPPSGQAARADDWAQAGHDPAENFDNAAESTIGTGNVRQLTTAWSVRPSLNGGQPLVYRGTVYRITAAASGSGVLTATRLSTGQVLWSRAAGSAGLVPTLAAAGDGEVLYGTAGPSEDLVAVSARTGARRWSVPDTEFTAGGASEVLIDGSLIVNGVVNVQILRAATGRVLWQATDGTGSGGPAAFAVSGSQLVRLARLSGKDYLESVALRTGASQWKRQAPCGGPGGSDNANLAIGGTVIYLHASCSATVRAYQLSTGARAWRASDPGAQAQVGLATAGGLVYAVGQRRGQAVVRAYAAGRIRWQSALGGGSGAGMTPTLANGVLYVTATGPLHGTSATERTAAFSAATGARLWTSPVQLESGDIPFVADGRLLVGSRVYLAG